jgi:hypothetical protein
VLIYNSGHVKTAMTITSPVRVGGDILGSWETESFRAKHCAMQQSDGFRSFIILYLRLTIYCRFSSIKSYYCVHCQLIENDNHRKKMRTCFVRCYNVTQKQITFTNPQKRRVLKYRKLEKHVKQQNIANEPLINKKGIFHFLWFVVYSIIIFPRPFLFSSCWIRQFWRLFHK